MDREDNLADTLHLPLNTEELQGLQAFLQEKDIHSVMLFFGYLSAVVSSPTVISPTIWLHGLFGERALFRDTTQSTAVLYWIARVEHRIRLAFQEIDQITLDHLLMYPLDGVKFDMSLHLQPWCQGYMRAVLLEPVFFLNTQYQHVQQALNFILILAATDEMLEASLEEEGIKTDKEAFRQEALSKVFAAIQQIYQASKEICLEE